MRPEHTLANTLNNAPCTLRRLRAAPRQNRLALRLRLWGASRSHLALEAGGAPEDARRHEAERRLRELLGAFVRLRRRYDGPQALAAAAGRGGKGGGGGGGEAAAATAAAGAAAAPADIEELERQRRAYDAQQAAAAAVRAAAIAPDRPPAACSGVAAAVAASALLPPGGAGAAGIGIGGSASDASFVTTASTSTAAAASASAARLAGAASSGSLSAAAAAAAAAEGEAAPRVPAEECTPEAAAAGAAAPPRAHRPWRWGWWGSSSAGEAPSADDAHARRQQQQQQQAEAGGSGNGADHALDAWAPPSRSAMAASTSGRTGSGGWPWQRLRLSLTGGGGGGSAVGRGSGGSGVSGGPGAFEERMLSRAAGWRLDPSGMDLGDRVIWAGEAVHLLRPLIYVCLLKRHGLRSWRPWAASLGLELLSQYALATGHHMLRTAGAAKWPRGTTLYSLALLRGLTARRWGPAERQELAARRVGLLRYLLRSPCYDSFTRGALARAARAGAWLPLAGPLGAYVLELIDSMQGYYTYIES